MKIKRILLVSGALFTGFIFWGCSQSESYCFFYPGIDTQYAPGFSEQAFAQIKVRMTEIEVQKILCVPLTIGQNAGSDLRYCYYTSDGKCQWGDWAWLVRMVKFKAGRVDEIWHYVAYD